MKIHYLTVLFLLGGTLCYGQSSRLVEIIGGNEFERNTGKAEAEQYGAALVSTTAKPENQIILVVIPPQVESMRRSLIVSTGGIELAQSRGIARSLAVAEGVSDANVAITKITAPESNPASSVGDLSAGPGEEAYEISYLVDPTSRLKGEVYFRSGRTDITEPITIDFLNQLAEAMNDPKLEGFRFVIEGHASSEGSAQGNQRLSQARANAVFDYLTESPRNVDPSRLLVVGYGESEARHPASAGERTLAEDRRILIYKCAKIAGPTLQN